MIGIDRVTKKYLTECYDAIFYVPSEPCMVNQTIIVNDIPIGVITEATEDYVKCKLFGRYIGTEYDTEYKEPISVNITTNAPKENI